MDFGSEYILDEEEEQQEVKMPVPKQHRSRRPRPPRYAMGGSGGFECEIMDFDEEEEDQQTQQKGGGQKKVDTNNVNLTMESLTKPSDKTLLLSQKLNCQSDKCGAVFSHLAKVLEKEGKQIWKCPFCDAENEAAEELPILTDQLTDVMYVEDTSRLPNMVPPPNKDNYTIIFAVDTSASMCQTIEISREGTSPGLQRLYDQGLLAQQQFLAQMSPDDNMRQMIQQMRSGDKLEVTRLMLVKDAVVTALEDLKLKRPNVRVGLVVFNEKVAVLGDGRRDRLNAEVEGGVLMDMAELKLIGQQNSELRPISESADDLIREVEGLQEEGRTALGPALLIAEKMASSKGSKVILLTDGFANIGLGKLEESTQQDIDKFYDSLIMTCKIDGVSVSVITCDEAGINNRLGDIPDETGGIVQKIEAKDYKALLKEELERQAAATDGLLNFVVGKNMYVKVKDDNIKNSAFGKILGNIHLGKRIPLKFAMLSPAPATTPATAASSASPPAPANAPAPAPANASAPPPAPTNAPPTNAPPPAPANAPPTNAPPPAPANAPASTPAPVGDPSTNASTAADGAAPPTSSGGTPPSTATTTVGTDNKGYMLERLADNAEDMDQTDPNTGVDPQPPIDTATTSATNQDPSDTNMSDTTDNGDTAMDQTANQDHQTASQDQSDTTMSDEAVRSQAMDHSDGGEPNTAGQPQQPQPPAEADSIQCPFQVQIKYRDMYGTVAVRVWTKQKKLTKNRQQAEDGMNAKSTVTSFLQTAAASIIAAKVTERLQLVQDLTHECKDLQNKIKSDDRNNHKKLIDFEELLALVGQNSDFNDEVATKLRACKEARSMTAQA